MSASRGAVHAKWIVGRVMGTRMPKTAKVRVTRLVLDPYLLKFYNKRKTYFAHDPQRRCVEGDVVLLRALPERRTKRVRHELAEIVHKVGNRTDPMADRRRQLPESAATESLTERDADCLSAKLRELAVSAPEK